MLTTLLSPSSGEAVIGGHDLRRDPINVRRQIGYVPQNGSSWAESKVAEEIVFQGRIHGLSAADARAHGALLATRFELNDLDERQIKTLSGGQRRRLDIVLGLIHSPGLVFLDEPTSGLDPQSRANLWEHIRKLRTDHGVTVFLTTHYLDEADGLADRVLVIDNGVIVSAGTPRELKANISSDLITAAVPAKFLTDAAEIAKCVAGALEVSLRNETVHLRAAYGEAATPELLRALDARGIPVHSIELHRPTLDDVFLRITGRSLRDRPVDTSIQEATRAP